MLNDERQQKLTSLGLLILRLAFGLIMLGSHGWGKMLKLFGEGPVKFPDPFGVGATVSLGLAVGAEVLCAALLVLGLFTRLAALPLLVTMLVAAFVIHGADPFKKQEMALLYGVVYLVLLIAGPGAFSLDALIAKKRAS